MCQIWIRSTSGEWNDLICLLLPSLFLKSSLLRMSIQRKNCSLLSTKVAIIGGTVMLCLCVLITPTYANDDSFIRFFTDAGNMVEIENRPMDNSAHSTSLSLVPASSHTHGHLSKHKIETRSGNKQHYCGELLVSALSLVCKGIYKKRSQNLLSGEVDCKILTLSLIQFVLLTVYCLLLSCTVCWIKRRH